MGDKRKCGRCQAYELGAFSAHVKNAPPGIFSSWCHDCIIKVQNGAPAILYGVSIDHAGNVIRSGSQPAAAVHQSPHDRLRSAGQTILAVVGVEGALAALGFVLIGISLISPNPNATRTMNETVLTLALFGATIVRSVMVLAALNRLEKRKTYGMAMLVAVLTALPAGVCLPLSSPIGIWAIMLLSRKEIKAEFR